MHQEQPFTPALGFHWLTPLYDPLMRLLPEQELFDALVEVADLQPGERVLDVGCGTGALTMALARSCPEAEVFGVDIDPEVLVRARRKLQAEGIQAQLVEGSAGELPFEAKSFDLVTSSLVFHHLSHDVKQAALREILRVLAPGGRFFLTDWGAPQDRLMRAAFLAVQLVDGFETTDDNLRGRLPDLMGEAGFEEVAEIRRKRTYLGVLSLFRAQTPV